MDLTDIQKFCYLESTSKGDAKHILDSLETTLDNSEVVCNLLKSCYHNLRIIDIRALFDLPLSTRESHVILRKIADHTQKHM